MENNERNNVELEQNVEETVETTEEVNEVVETVVTETPIMSTPEKVSNDTSSSDKIECCYKPNIALLVAVTLLAVGSVIGVLLYYINSTPSLKFMRVVNTAFAEVENALDESMVDHKSQKATMSLDIEATSNQEELKPILDILNGLDLSIESAIDYEKGAISAKLETEYKDKDMIDLDVFVQGKKAWLDSKDLLENPLYTELDEEIEFNTDKEDIEAYKAVIVGVKNALNVAVKDEYITKEKNGKYTDYTMTISGEENITFTKDLITALKNDDTFVGAVAKLGEIEKDEVIDELVYAIEELEEPEADASYPETVLTFSMKGNDLKEVTLLETMDGETVTFKAELVDDETVNFSVEAGTLGTASGYLKVKEGKNNKVSEELYVKVVASGMEVAVKVNMDVTNEFDVKVTNTLSKNSVNAEDLTEDEQTAITTKLQENEALKELMEDIEALMPEEDDYYTTDDDYDDFYYDDEDYDYYSDDDYYYYD